MSYFIANSISISKDRKTYKVRGGDNNVVPRSNYWLNDWPLENLYYGMDSGNVRLIAKDEKACFINWLVRDMKWEGDWDKQTDYYHIHGLPKTKEELAKVIEELKPLALKNNYYKKALENKIAILEKFDYWRERLDKFNEEFLRRLNEGLDNICNKPTHIIALPNIDSWIIKLHRNGASYSVDRERALKLTKYRAILEGERFEGSQVVEL